MAFSPIMKTTNILEKAYQSINGLKIVLLKQLLKNNENIIEIGSK